MRRTMGSISSTVSQLLLCLSTALYVSAESQQHQIISGHPVTGKLLLPGACRPHPAFPHPLIMLMNDIHLYAKVGGGGGGYVRHAVHMY